MNRSNPKLFQGAWRVGNGLDIPLNHPVWYPSKTAPISLNPQLATVCDLINHTSASKNNQIVNKLYDTEECNQILNIIPLSKLNHLNLKDKIIWPHSTDGNFQVKKLYNPFTSRGKQAKIMLKLQTIADISWRMGIINYPPLCI